jgi:hypothetical protein
MQAQNALRSVANMTVKIRQFASSGKQFGNCLMYPECPSQSTRSSADTSGHCFTTVVGRDLIISFDLPRAESSFALTPKPVAATTTAIAPNDANIDFALIVKPPFSYASARYHAGREIETQTTSPLTDGALEAIG